MAAAHLFLLGCVVALSAPLSAQSSAEFGIASEGAPAILVPGSALDGRTVSELPYEEHLQPDRSEARIVVRKRAGFSWTDVRELPHSLRGQLIADQASAEALLDALRPYAGLEPNHTFEMVHLPEVMPRVETYAGQLLIAGSRVIGSTVMLMVDPDSREIRFFNASNLLHAGDHLPEPLAMDPSTALSLVLDAVGHHRVATDGHNVARAYVMCEAAVHSVWWVGLRSTEEPKPGTVIAPGESPRIWRQVTADADVTDSSCAEPQPQ